MPLEKRRRPLVACLLALIACGGLGQLYNGQPRKAFFFYVLSMGWLFSWGLLVGTFAGAIVFIAGGFLIALIAIIDAGVGASRIGVMPLRKYNRWYAYLLAFAVYFASYDAVEWVNREYFLEAYKLPSKSMEPTLKVGDHLIALKRPYASSQPERGDIVAFPFPDNPKLLMIKRIVALPGDAVSVQGPQLTVNGRTVEENYVQWTQGGAAEAFSVTVPPGQVFVLGDNRDASVDSRKFGFVPLGELDSKILYVYLNPRDFSRIGYKDFNRSLPSEL